MPWENKFLIYHTEVNIYNTTVSASIYSLKLHYEPPLTWLLAANQQSHSLFTAGLERPLAVKEWSNQIEETTGGKKEEADVTSPIIKECRINMQHKR
jgi:hypothetical protein